jgi:hypothetical protein
VAILLFAGSFYLYVTDYPLRRLLFNIDDEGHGHPVGRVSLLQGGLRRQFSGEAEFKGIDRDESLYDEDTLVTGPDSTATLVLDDGSTIELAPNTMVRLHFLTRLTLGGISRAASVDVVAGDIKNKGSDDTRLVVHKAARPIVVAKVIPVPKPPPPPIDPEQLIAVKKVDLIAPRQGTQLALDKGTQVLEKPVSFTWHVTPPNRAVEVTLFKLASRAPGAPRTEVFRQVVADKDGQGTVDWKLSSPGYYEWQLRDSKGKPIPGARRSSALFWLDPDFEGIDPLEPLVGGEALSSSKLNGRQLKNFDITLRWKPFPGADKYRIAIRTRPTDPRPVLEKTVAQPQYLFNKNKVYNGEIYYQIQSSLRSGFVAHSPVKPFVFSFLAPVPVTPLNHARISADELANEGDSVLITWQKTNFTDYYDLEIAKDPDFKAMAVKERLKENFYVFRSPPPARYYWRVRSSTQQVISPYSTAYDLEIGME